MSQICGMSKNPVIYVEVGITGQTDRPFLAPNAVLRWEGSRMSHDVERLWGWRAELNGGAQRAWSYRPRCNGVIAPWPRPQSTSGSTSGRTKALGLTQPLTEMSTRQ
jgi:hypothetical protein